MRTKRKIAMRAALAAGMAALGFAFSHAQTDQVRYYGPLSRVITPNGDGINDLVYFCFENPADSEISGKIYTLLGTEVASIGPKRNRSVGAGQGCPASIIQAQFTTWDGTAGNVRVRSGVYVYRITSEGRVFTGTLLVAR
jgi:hypothetical protein